MNSEGSLRFLITCCPATEIVDCILLPCGTMLNVCPEITFSFMLKLLVLSFLQPLKHRRRLAFTEFSHYIVRASPFVRPLSSPIFTGLRIGGSCCCLIVDFEIICPQSLVPVHVSLPLLPASSMSPALVVSPFCMHPLHSTGAPCWLSHPIKLRRALDA